MFRILGALSFGEPKALVEPEDRVELDVAGFEERESFGQLLACVDEAVERLDEPREARIELHRLWRCLRSHAAGSAGSTSGRADSGPPSRRGLARLLDVSRNRLADLLTTLRRLVAGCRADTSEGHLRKDRS